MIVRCRMSDLFGFQNSQIYLNLNLAKRSSVKQAGNCPSEWMVPGCLRCEDTRCGWKDYRRSLTANDY